MSEWQKLNNVPTGGAEFQAWVVTDDGKGFWEPRARFNEHGNFEIWGRVDYDEEGWDSYPHLMPTHWMPPPKPPA